MSLLQIAVLAGMDLDVIKLIHDGRPKAVDHLCRGLMHVLDISYQKGAHESFKYLFEHSKIDFNKLFRWECSKYLAQE